MMNPTRRVVNPVPVLASLPSRPIRHFLSIASVLGHFLTQHDRLLTPTRETQHLVNRADAQNTPTVHLALDKPNALR